MTVDLATQRFTHRANIARYRKILTTFLTPDERRFVEHRLAEEQAAIQQQSTSTARLEEAACGA